MEAPPCPTSLAPIVPPEVRAALTTLEHGILSRLADHAWAASPPGTLPLDHQLLARLAGVEPAVWNGCCSVVTTPFVKRAGRYAWPLLISLWEEASRRATKLSESGREGARRRWGGHSHPNGPPNGLPNGVAIATPKPPYSQAIPPQSPSGSASAPRAKADIPAPSSSGAPSGALGADLHGFARGAEARLPTVEFQLRRARWPWALKPTQRSLPHSVRENLARRLPEPTRLYTAFVLWRIEASKPENPVGAVIAAFEGEDAPWTVEPEFFEHLRAEQRKRGGA